MVSEHTKKCLFQIGIPFLFLRVANSTHYCITHAHTHHMSCTHTHTHMHTHAPTQTYAPPHTQTHLGLTLPICTILISSSCFNRLVFSEQIVKKSAVAMPKAQTDKDRSAGAGGPSQTSLAGECLEIKRGMGAVFCKASFYLCGYNSMWPCSVCK